MPRCGQAIAAELVQGDQEHVHRLLQAPIAELGHNGGHVPVVDTREANERDEIVRFLKMTNGRVAGPDGAAAKMDVKRTTLISRMKRLGIDPQRVL